MPGKLPQQIIVEKTKINSINKKYRDFLVPGIISMAIMQGGIFGVVFTLIRFKSQGVLRRLQASPIGPSHFLVGQGFTRVIISLLQPYVLVIAAFFLLKVYCYRTISEAPRQPLSKPFSIVNINTYKCR